MNSPESGGIFAVEAIDVRRRYTSGGGPDYEAVRGVSLQVRQGEMFALLGTNGAGKTSLMELLEGMAPALEGTVRILGLDPFTERAAVRPRIGILLQAGGFPGELTVAETVRMWAACTTAARPPAEVLELVGLTGRADVKVKQLSGGETRRLDLAVAVLGRPEVLFLDEPTTGMDPEGRRDTWRLVRELQEDGTTVLLTTHYLAEAEELADRLAIVHEGLIGTVGTPAEVIADHPSRITFLLPEGASPESLPSLGQDQTTERSGRRITIRTQQLQETLFQLLAWAGDRSLNLEGLDARAASLEEVFLGMAASPSPSITQGTS
ncbi:ABC transporter ATP-binding protein [Actinocorallia lasiicapitis]